MKHLFNRRALALLLAIGMLLAAQAFADGFAADLAAKLAEPDMTHRVAARWWLAEGSHTDQTLEEGIEELYQDGFGAVEFLAMDESAFLDEARYSWGTQEWIDDSRFIVEECTKRGMGVSFTSGTHWSNANIPTIDPDQEAAAQELGYVVVSLAAGEAFQGALSVPELPAGVTKATLVRVIAAQVTGTTEEGRTLLDEASLKDVTKEATQGDDGAWQLAYTAPEGADSLLFAFWQYGTGQFATPAVETNYVINYYSREGSEALINYWNDTVLTPELRQVIQENGQVSMYMDSLELEAKGTQTTGNLWCADYLEQFEARRGYDVSRYLPILILDWTGKNPRNPQAVTQRYYYELDGLDDMAARIRNDLYQTNTELYTDNCLNVLSDWLHSFGMTLRAENSYGLLLEISQPIASIDYVEGESLEFGTEIERYRGQTGAAHLYDKVYSSETGAVAMSNYWFDSAYYRQMFFSQFAAGVQKTVTHGFSTSYGPEGSVNWPGFDGMWAMYGTRFSARQPSALDYPAYWGEINHIQTVLRQGVPQVDLGILRTDYNFDVMSGGGGLAINRSAHQNTAFYWQDMGLQNAGYTYDYFSPYLLTDEAIACEGGLVQPEGVGYQALVLYQEELPLESAERLLDWAKNGLPVVLVTGETDEQVRADLVKHNRGAALTTGAWDGNDEALAAVVDELKAQSTVRCVDSEADAAGALAELGVLPRAAYGEPNANLLTAMRRDGDTVYLYVHNFMFEQDEPFAAEIAVAGGKPYRIDTVTGEVAPELFYEVRDGRTVLNVCLAPGEAALYAFNGAADGRAIVEATNVADAAALEDGIALLVPESGEAEITWSDGERQSFEAQVPEVAMGEWTLTVESWTAGEKLERTEDKGLGYVTTEYAYDTDKTAIEVGATDLIAWKDIEGVGETVSGVGVYANTFTLPEDWSAESCALFFHADSFGGGTARVLVNGVEVPVNMVTCAADITGAAQPGENAIEVRVTSSLRNVLLANGYADVGLWAYAHSNDMAPADYGMIGQATVTPCAIVRAD